jgi:hypothetical protein
MITEFRCHIAQSVIDDLKFRIRHTRWTDEIVGSGWLYGADLSYMKELADYWVGRFDWRKVENEINQYPNYIAEIDGIKIHFFVYQGEGESICSSDHHAWLAGFFS